MSGGPRPVELGLSDNAAAARYEAHFGDVRAGVLDYHSQPGLITLLHTEVEREFEGSGVGGQLIAHALDDIRSRGMKVLPICPFVISYIQRHPEYEDLRYP